MPDLPLFGGGPVQAGVNLAGSDGVLVNAHASAHTKGSWTEIIASTTYATSWLMVTAGALRTTLQNHLFDIGIGASTAEVVLIPNLFHSLEASSNPQPRQYLLPLGVPAGSRLSARTQGSVGGGGLNLALHCFAAPITGPPPLSRVEACGVVAGSTVLTPGDAGATPHTDSAWIELIAATSFPYRWLLMTLSQDAAAGAEPTYLVDIGVGPAGSEVELIPDISDHVGNTAEGGGLCVGVPISVGGGVRVSYRFRCSSGVNNDRDIEFAVWGVG